MRPRRPRVRSGRLPKQQCGTGALRSDQASVTLSDLPPKIYPAFLKERLARLVEKVKEVTGKEATPLPDNVEPGGEDTDDEADPALEMVATPDVPDTLVAD